MITHLPSFQEPTMATPLHILFVKDQPPDLITSAFGPFVVHSAAHLADASVQLGERAHDAVVCWLAGDEAVGRLLAWASFEHAAMTCALLVVTPEPRPADALRLTQLGVQDVLPTRDATPEALGRAIRLAIERKALDRAARRAYGTDLSTGLPNHSQLLEHMTHLLALREREPASMAVIVMRVQGYAGAEATLGAEAANVLKRKIAVRLRASLRASDVVASLGDDQFAVLLAWIDAPEDAEGVASKLVRSLQQPFGIAGQEMAVSAAVGLSQYPAHGQDAQTLLRRAIGQATDSTLGRQAGPGAAAANDESGSAT